MSDLRTNGPDFLCVGMQKAGTQWLYDQLATCSGAWMPPIKELNFWEGSFGKTSNLKQMKRMLDTDREEYGAVRPETPQFLSYLKRFGESGPRTLEDYLGLFQFKGDRISGDISPVYATMSASGVNSVARALPMARVVLLVRHPVDRLKSALSMHVRKNKIPATVLTDWPRLAEYLARSSYRNRSFPTRTWKVWQDAFGPRARFWFFDHIVAEPERVRSEIADHVRIFDPQFTLAANFNRKATKQKFTLSPAVEQGLYRLLGDEIREAVRIFGGPAEAWQTA